MLGMDASDATGMAHQVHRRWRGREAPDDEGTLDRIAISNRSDPFSEVTLDETTVTAVSTAGRVWAFPRHAPQQVEITADPAHPWRR
ncbi:MULTISPECIES: hypothetical protein [unclassified Streptomyces]|uniref:hypothetical protein n=1 Tax=unclassified Streptomyces TaxID=2593676 RepID=UPI00131C0B7B|nr:MULTISPECIES: hypothetical protein [unclassified Streptomyces]